MVHSSENCTRLAVTRTEAKTPGELIHYVKSNPDVNIIWLPSDESKRGGRLCGLDAMLAEVSKVAKDRSTIITVGEVQDLVHSHEAISKNAKFQLWIAVKRRKAQNPADKVALPNLHFGCLVHTKYFDSLEHTKTRIGYSYCPACEKTTKDYGGKKHVYHEYGTLMSDVWRDIEADLKEDIEPVIDRFSDFFGLKDYSTLQVIDCRGIDLEREMESSSGMLGDLDTTTISDVHSALINGDCLDELRKLPSNSVDFAFADPPYNLGKKYSNYADSIEIEDYFGWCDKWISEMERVLKPGRTCAILNIPLWAIRHFHHMEKTMLFQNWIVWDALSLPVRMLMPSHYSIICFTKGPSRGLPGLNGNEKWVSLNDNISFRPLQPLSEGYCLRSDCVRKRERMGIQCRSPLSDIWWDIHRLKHNTRRVDHPCQLPPELMYRLITIFTRPGEVVLDCFNGAGTTTLTAAQLGRKYLGIEMAPQYHELARKRHEELESGLNPFRKEERVLISKNSPVRRMPKMKYLVPKRTLQLDVKRISKAIGHIPSREEVERLSTYPIAYFDEYFINWGEVCAAARTTGMSEKRNGEKVKLEKNPKQSTLM